MTWNPRYEAARTMHDSKSTSRSMGGGWVRDIADATAVGLRVTWPNIDGLAKADGRSGSGLETCGSPRAAQMIRKVALQSIGESCCTSTGSPQEPDKIQQS